MFPIAGGDPHAVADHGFLPRWKPDGRQIAFTRAYYRLSDYGLDMDGWVVGVDEAGRATSPAKSWIAGFGEDMGPVWSPDGRWVAYHSHRSATAVPLYESPGRTDDEWLMLAVGRTRNSSHRLRVRGRPSRLGARRPPHHLRFVGKGRRASVRQAVDRDDRSRNGPIDSARSGCRCRPALPASRVKHGRRAPRKSRSSNGSTTCAARSGSHARTAAMRTSWWTSRATRSVASRGRRTDSELLYSALIDDRMQIFAIPRTGGTPRQLTHGDVNMMHPSVSPDGRLVAASRIPWHKELWRLPLR